MPIFYSLLSCKLSFRNYQWVVSMKGNENLGPCRLTTCQVAAHGIATLLSMDLNERRWWSHPVLTPSLGPTGVVLYRATVQETVESAGSKQLDRVDKDQGRCILVLVFGSQMSA